MWDSLELNLPVFVGTLCAFWSVWGTNVLVLTDKY